MRGQQHGVGLPARPKNGLSLCGGGGGLDMGLHLAEPTFRTRMWVEIEEYPRSVLIAAQRAGYFAAAPIWDDVTTFDATPFRGAFDAILAGYPCQPFSHAGQRKGASDERHLWPDVARIIREIEPEWVFLENVAGHVTLGAETVLRELWDMGFTPATGIFSASTGQRWEAALEPAICRMADGLAIRSRALRLLGNGVHPLAAAHAWRALASAHGLRALDLEATNRSGTAGHPDDLAVEAAE